ncbi:MAG: MmcQ/YjbR family DNA-binding protein [Solirubrobacterales bacterium]|jgi:hypothetical protein|nr:MmcQ/YjbR family DNA-binding protein [Solirubrobacterales bacterium]
MLTAQDARTLALALPEATEEDHHGRPSFRVHGKIFATLWTAEVLNVMPGEERILGAVAEVPQWCSEVHWGGRLAAVSVHLALADRELVADLLAEAWTRRAPRRLVRAFPFVQDGDEGTA